MNAANLRLINALGLLGISFILYVGFVLQFLWNELPCPLCLLQRVGFAFVAIGFMLNVVQGPRPANYGVVLFGAIFGAACALRQVCLHIVPGTGHFGSPIFGIHYYSWAFMLFSATILAVAVLLAMTTAILLLYWSPLKMQGIGYTLKKQVNFINQLWNLLRMCKKITVLA